MTRFDIINRLMAEHGFESYLEIGTQLSIGGQTVKAKHKTGVDPAPMEIKDSDYDEFHQMTSDDFFAKNTKKFDLIFIDGDHSYDQSSKDFVNSMECLNKYGKIVMHDCLPHCEEYTSLLWNGEVYKTINDIHRTGLDFIIYEADHGCAVIPFQKFKRLAIPDESFTYDQFVESKKHWSIISC